MIPLIVEGLDEYRATGSGVSLPYYMSILGEAYTQAGRFEEARRTLNEALAIADTNDDRCQEAELHRLLGGASCWPNRPATPVPRSASVRRFRPPGLSRAARGSCGPR